MTPKPSPETLRSVIAWLEDQLPKYGGGSMYCNINGTPNFNLVGRFHENRTLIETQLREMYANGQRHIGVILWFMPMNWPNIPPDHTWNHTCDSYGGRLFAQHSQNVADFVRLIRQIGFEELHFRFAPQGGVAWVANWTTWNQTQFNENAAFMHSVRALVEADKGELRLVYDLAVEHGNEKFDTTPLHRQYCIELWRSYVTAYGPADSCGFTVIHGGAGVRAMLNRIREAGLPFPSCYCVDSYGFEYVALTGVQNELVSAGETGKPIFLQETFYNDPQVATDVRRAVQETGMNLAGVYQWPIVRGTDPHSQFYDLFPRAFDNYANLI